MQHSIIEHIKIPNINAAIKSVDIDNNLIDLVAFKNVYLCKIEYSMKTVENFKLYYTLSRQQYLSKSYG